ncbi:cytochrome P450 4C1-like [Phymastichus coffea]|uniref:cytochrome P450 4C1-like n=1 Tax=Phymastichus coffea TaxID=108790 RepID=UPI00273CF0CC|nr:cytochrome P450 4C1-like [Phymastichus coffea]
MIYVLSFTVIVLMTAFNIFVRYRRKGRLANIIPGPSPYPFIGNMLSFDIGNPVKLWEVIRSISHKWYPVTRVWMTTEALFSIRHPDDFEILFTSQRAITKGFTYNHLHCWLRTGLLTSTGEKWRKRRRMLTPAFHFNILPRYMDITVEQGEQLIQYLSSSGKETVESIFPLISQYTLNIICEAAMGLDLSKIDQKITKKYKETIHTIGNFVVWRMPRPYIHDWMLRLTPFLKFNRDMKNALSVLHDFTNKVVQERRKYHEENGYNYLQDFSDEAQHSEKNIYIGRKKKLAMLDLLLALEKDGLIDDEGIREEVDTFTFEGHDTTAAAISYTLMLLAENKDAQDAARAEVTAVLKNTNGKIGMREIQEFNYLECCIKESMRLYPPVSTVFRQIQGGDIQLKHALIPDGAHVICQIFDLHRDANFWLNPEKFNPERFLAENSQNRHPFAYLPMSAGPRNCIGQKFAMNELKSLIGKILYHFHLEPVEPIADMKLIADIILRPSEPVHLKFIRIDK